MRSMMQECTSKIRWYRYVLWVVSPRRTSQFHQATWHRARFALALLLVSLSVAAATANETIGVAASTEAISSATRPTPDQSPRLEAFLASLPLSFEANKGQFDEQVRFLARGHRRNVFITTDGMHLVLDNPEPNADRVVVRIQFDGSRKGEFSGIDRLQAITNYFKQGTQITDVPNFLKVRQLDVYPGIDVIYYGKQGWLEHDFMIFPGAEIAAITLKLSGHQSAEVSANGDLAIKTQAGEATLHKPIAYQESDGERVNVPAKYRLVDNAVQFEVEDYDRTRPLIIDPILSYSTYFAGSSTELGRGIAVDSGGNTYITGLTSSTDLPVVGAYQSTIKGFNDAFISKFNANGTGLIYSTYLGGKDNKDFGSFGTAIAVDSAGNTFVTGTTTSGSFPTTSGAYQTTITANSGFVTKLNAQGNALVYSTLIRGGEPAGIAIDSSGNAYITGTGYSGFTTTPGAFQTTPGNQYDAFVAKLNATGTAMIYASYLGGDGEDYGRAIAIDSSGHAYVAGSTLSSNFPVANPYQAIPPGGWSAFVTKVNSAGTGLIYSTYLGGSNIDHAFGIAVDAQGNAHVVGQTASSNFPVHRAFQPTRGVPPNGQAMTNGFITKLNSTGSALVYSSYLGGNGCELPAPFTCGLGYEDHSTGVALDAAGNAYLTGETRSLSFPQVDPIVGTLSPYSNIIPFVAKVQDLANTNAALAYSVALGRRDSTTEGGGNGISVDLNGNAYVIARLTATAAGPFSFPVTPGAFQTSVAPAPSACCGRVVVFKVSPGRFTTSLASSHAQPTSAQSVTLTATVGSAVPGGTVTFASGGNTIGTAPMSQGRASLTTALSPGVHQITATYSGDNKVSQQLFLPVTQALMCN